VGADPQQSSDSYARDVWLLLLLLRFLLGPPPDGLVLWLALMADMVILNDRPWLLPIIISIIIIIIIIIIVVIVIVLWVQIVRSVVFVVILLVPICLILVLDLVLVLVLAPIPILVFVHARIYILRCRCSTISLLRVGCRSAVSSAVSSATVPASILLPNLRRLIVWRRRRCGSGERSSVPPLYQ